MKKRKLEKNEKKGNLYFLLACLGIVIGILCAFLEKYIWTVILNSLAVIFLGNVMEAYDGKKGEKVTEILLYLMVLFLLTIMSTFLIMILYI